MLKAHDENRNSHSPIGDMEGLLVISVNHVDEPTLQRIRRVEDDLHCCTDYHQNSTVVRIATGKVVPYNDHNYATCDSNHYDTGSVGG